MWQGIDQRKFPRANYECIVKLRQQEGSLEIPSRTENVGLGGVCVILDRGLDIFAPVDLEIRLDDGRPPILAQGTIVWVVRRRQVREAPHFDTGVEFSDLSAQDKARLEAMLDKRRRSP